MFLATSQPNQNRPTQAKAVEKLSKLLMCGLKSLMTQFLSLQLSLRGILNAIIWSRYIFLSPLTVHQHE